MRKQYFVFNKNDEPGKRKLWEFLKNIPDGNCPACKDNDKKKAECDVCQGTGKVAVDYIIEIKKNHAIRSIKQNAYYWVVITIYSIHTGHTKKEIENMFKMDCHFEVVTYPNGRQKIVPAETHETDTAEFTAIVNKLLQWGRENFPEVIIPRQEDVRYKELMEIENEHDRVFSGF